MAEMTFKKRLRLYMIGVVIGLPIMWFMVRRKQTIKFPSEIIVEQMSAKPLVYTHHARCRMECRNISEDEIIAILKTGDVNFGKSEPHATPCKKYAIEGKTNDGQEVRIIFAQCDDVTKVITAIDLDVEHTCHCE
jgi:Domain of unknown function (DUF4258)